jgi:uncharacterized protein (TIGR02611 family)
MNQPAYGEGSQRNVVMNADGKDWKWRRKIRANAHSHRIYRLVVAIAGLAIVVFGLLLVPFPGPGWLVVILGVGVWSSEFEWAQRLLHAAKRTLQVWNSWVKAQPVWIKGLLLVLTIALVAAVFWLLFIVSGVPGFFPDSIEQWLSRLPGLEG